MAKPIETKPAAGRVRNAPKSGPVKRGVWRRVKCAPKHGKRKPSPAKTSGRKAPKGESTKTTAKRKLTRAEASRQNGAKSKGPKTVEGKNSSRFNALTHGLTATKVEILAGEEAVKYQERLAAWRADLQPRNPVELHWVDDAVWISWLRDRAFRAETARLMTNINNGSIEKQQREEEDALALGQILFADNRGPTYLFPTPRKLGVFGSELGGPRTSTAVPDDPNTPQRVVLRLSFTIAGCKWLIGEWMNLTELLDQGLCWQSPDRFKAIRLLGRQPLDVADDMRLVQIFAACHALNPEGDDAFADLWPELVSPEANRMRERLIGRKIDHFLPPSKQAAAKVLYQIVGREVHKLEQKLADLERRAQVNAALEQDALAFDESSAGDRLRRYGLSLGRAMFRTFDTISTVRRMFDERPDADLSEFLPPEARVSVADEAETRIPTRSVSEGSPDDYPGDAAVAEGVVPISQGVALGFHVSAPSGRMTEAANRGRDDETRRPEGAAHDSPGQRPGDCGRDDESRRPEGAAHDSPGQRPGDCRKTQTKSRKGDKAKQKKRRNEPESVHGVGESHRAHCQKSHHQRGQRGEAHGPRTMK